MFTIINVRSPKEEKTARTRIRDSALKLFAELGADAVSIRDVAAEAGVSAALVIRHYSSKDGLRKEVDEYVLRTFDAMLKELTNGSDIHDPANAGSLAEAVLRNFPAGSPIPRYLCRMLLDRSMAGRRLFRRLFKAGSATLRSLIDLELASPGRDFAVRAAFLTSNDLAVFLLRDHLTALLGFDPLSTEGMARWGGEVLDIYAAGLGAKTATRGKKGKTRREK